jgi:uncharacterized phage infection (PIP) family protein YhgE
MTIKKEINEINKHIETIKETTQEIKNIDSEHKFIDFENWLEDKFIGKGVDGETPITKDNCENLFDRFLSEIDTQELIEYADLYGQSMYLTGQQRALKDTKKFREEVEMIKPKIEKEYELQQFDEKINEATKNMSDKEKKAYFQGYQDCILDYCNEIIPKCFKNRA